MKRNIARQNKRKEAEMPRGKRTGVGGGRGTGKGYKKGGLRTGPKNSTGPRAKAGTCVKKKK